MFTSIVSSRVMLTFDNKTVGPNSITCQLIGSIVRLLINDMVCVKGAKVSMFILKGERHLRIEEIYDIGQRTCRTIQKYMPCSKSLFEITVYQALTASTVSVSCPNKTEPCVNKTVSAFFFGILWYKRHCTLALGQCIYASFPSSRYPS